MRPLTSPPARSNPPFLLGTILFSISILSYLTFSTHRSSYRASSLAAHPSASNDLTKALVVAAMSNDDTTWTERRLPDWDSRVYIANDTRAPLTVPVNKGREAMVYLTYIIDHYARLPEIIAFVHARQYQWHNDDTNYDTATLLGRLQLGYVLREGYANLRCVWRPGCPNEIFPKTPISEEAAEHEFQRAFGAMFPGRSVPFTVAVSCCAQFAVSRGQVLRNTLEQYRRIRDWLVQTELDDEVSGRIVEYSWHMLFGRDAVHCPDARECYCNVFGLCGLDGCTQGDCGRYYLPPYSYWPPWWREDPEAAGVVISR